MDVEGCLGSSFGAFGVPLGKLVHLTQQWNPSAIASCAPAAVGECSHRPQGATGALDLSMMRHHRESAVSIFGRLRTRLTHCSNSAEGH